MMGMITIRTETNLVKEEKICLKPFNMWMGSLQQPEASARLSSTDLERSFNPEA
jgi:hypothetical protein